MQEFHAGTSSPSAALTFPQGFLWGTATSAHQVEGGNTANDWWAWEQQPGRIARGDRSGQACNWWRAAEADFDRMAALHQNAHRLSIEWSRLEPHQGQWDDRALRRYGEMLTGLRQRSITPMVTLHHFTFPLWVARRGGWLWPGLSAAFERFVHYAVGGLGDLTTLWCTFNEPVAAIINGYITGRFPPGAGGLQPARAAIVNSIRAHAAAYHAIHAVQKDAQVGIAAYLRVFDPARPASLLDRLVTGAQDRLINWAYLDALRDGGFRSPFRLTPLPEAANTMDFLGVNYYTRDLVRFDLRHAHALFGRNFHAPGAVLSDGAYSEVYPAGLYRMLMRAQAYGRPIYVTENGLPDEDDDLRPGFVVSHLREVGRALQAGCDVRGYLHWSLLDNFEWAEGWTLRFGLIALDPLTQARTPRPSAALYSEICRTGRVPSLR